MSKRKGIFLHNPKKNDKKQIFNQMETKRLFLGIAMGAALFFGSCSSENLDLSLRPNEPHEYGTLTVSLSADAKFNPTRALSEESYRNTANYNVKLVNTANDNVSLECKYSEIESKLPARLEIGSYRLEASYGKEQPFSRNEFLVTGQNVFTIKANEEKRIDMKCTPTCGKLLVEFSDDMATYFSDYNVVYSGTKAMGTNTCTWAKADTEPWYVAIEEAGEDIKYTINLVAKDDYLHSGADGSTSKEAKVEGTFNLKRNKAQKLTISPNYTPSTEGGLNITITIDDSTNDHEITWEVPVTWI